MATDLISRATIAEDLGLSLRYVTDKLVKRPDFPKPELRLTQKMVLYSNAKYQAWKRKRYAKSKT